MSIKKFAAVLTAALMVTAAAPSALTANANHFDANTDEFNPIYDYGIYDDEDNGNENANDNGNEDTDQGVTTTAPAPEYSLEQPAGNEVTSMITTTKEDKRTSAPSRVYLNPGEIKDDMVAVELRIEADTAVKEALISVTFDASMLQLASTQLNDEAGGKAVENSFNGKYVFNYTNESGSNYKGKYATLNFKLLDKSMATTTIFLTVTTLDNRSGSPISFTGENGIITNPNAPSYQPPEENAETPQNPRVTLMMSKFQVTPSEMGIEEYRNIVINDPSILSYEEGVISILAEGQTTMDVVFNNNDLLTYDMVVINDVAVPEAEEVTAPVEEVPQKPDNTKRDLFLLIAVAFGALALGIEYIVIMKPMGKRSRKLAEAEAFFESEDYEDHEDDEEMRADLQKAFAARDARRKAALEEDADDEADDVEDTDDDSDTSADDEE